MSKKSLVQFAKNYPMLVIFLALGIAFFGLMIWIPIAAHNAAKKEVRARWDGPQKIQLTTTQQSFYGAHTKMFQLFNKRMPESCLELKADENVGLSAVEDEWGNPMKLDAAEDHYSVTSAGLDQEIDTDDDIKTIFNNQHEVTEVVNGLTFEELIRHMNTIHAIVPETATPSRAP